MTSILFFSTYTIAFIRSSVISDSIEEIISFCCNEFLNLEYGVKFALAFFLIVLCLVYIRKSEDSSV